MTSLVLCLFLLGNGEWFVWASLYQSKYSRVHNPVIGTWDIHFIRDHGDVMTPLQCAMECVKADDCQTYVTGEIDDVTGTSSCSSTWRPYTLVFVPNGSDVYTTDKGELHYALFILCIGPW